MRQRDRMAKRSRIPMGPDMAGLIKMIKYGFRPGQVVTGAHIGTFKTLVEDMTMYIQAERCGRDDRNEEYSSN